jgi:Arc/MetJ family transcription regulator
MCKDMCEGDVMATNLQLDNKLIKQAVELGGHHTKRAAVTQALTDYIRNLQQEKILGLFGKVDFMPGYDYKRQRAKA